MQLTQLLSATAIVAALATGATAALAQPTPAPAPAGSMAPATGSMKSDSMGSMKSDSMGSMKSDSMGSMKSGSMGMMSGARYGGPSYLGAPDLPVTVAVVTAGGGAADFSTAKALTAMVGPTLTNAEVGKLTQQYGKEKVDSFITVFNYTVVDAVKIATADGIKLPAASPLEGKALAAELVKFGSAESTHDRFWTGDMLDHLVSHKIHDQVMDDIDKKYGAPADENYHVISNQAFYDIAQALSKG